MRIDVNFIGRWSETLNRLNKMTASYSTPQDPERIVQDFIDIGAQLPFDPACGRREDLYGYQRFVATVAKNEFLEVFKYLQNERQNFVSIQQMLGLHMGLFAYLDIESDSIRYLYGPGDYSDDLIDDTKKTQPHFVIKAFYEYRRSLGGDVWLEEPIWHFARMSESFYYSRRREGQRGQVWKVGFVRILDAEHSEQLSDWERRLGVIYAPSGEIDACILCWLFLHLDEETCDRLLGWCSSIVEGNVTEDDSLRFEFRLTESVVTRTRTRKGSGGLPAGHSDFVTESYYWGQGRSRTLVDWLESLGLLASPAAGARLRVVTPKGRAMVEWLAEFVRGNRDGDGPVQRLGGEVWLMSSRLEAERRQFLDLAARAYPSMGADGGVPALLAGVGNELEFRALAAGVKLLMMWQPPITPTPTDAHLPTPSAPASQFAAACRMSVHAHLVLRAGTRYRGMVENLPRAWLVFPVLHIPASKLELSQDMTAESAPGLKPVGFFLGTMRDLDEDGRTNPRLREQGQDTLAHQIAAIRALIQPLAEIENRETFFLDINNNQQQAAARKKATDLIAQLMQIQIDSAADAATVEARFRHAIAQVLFTADVSTGEVFAGVSRFDLLRELYRVLDDFLHIDATSAVPSQEAFTAYWKIAQRALGGLTAKRNPLQPFIAPDEAALSQLVTKLAEFASSSSPNITAPLSAAKDFKAALRSQFEARVVNAALAMIFSIPTFNDREKSFDFSAHCRFNIDAWSNVLDRHLDHATTDVVDHADRDTLYWLRVSGICKPDKRSTSNGGGYEPFAGGEAILSIDQILHGQTGRKWIESMVPRYFSPCLLETRNRQGWYCWDLSRYASGDACEVTELQFVGYTSAEPLCDPGVRVWVKIDTSLLRGHQR